MVKKKSASFIDNHLPDVPTLALRDVTYSYSRRAQPVLNGFSMTFHSGFTALLGRNGAGKSTVLSLLATLLEPNEGVVVMNDVPVRRRHVRFYRAKIGWMPQHIAVLPRFTVRETVEYYGWLAEVPRSVLADRIRVALQAVDLWDHADARVSSLSGGQLRRLGVAQTLVHDAQWLILDEPTAGLDPSQRQSLFALLRTLRGTVNLIVATHDIDGFETVVDRIAVMDHGRGIWEGSVAEFEGLAGSGASMNGVCGGGSAQSLTGSAGDLAFMNLLDVAKRSESHKETDE